MIQPDSAPTGLASQHDRGPAQNPEAVGLVPGLTLMSDTQMGLGKEKTAGRRERAVLQKQTGDVDCAFTTQSGLA